MSSIHHSRLIDTVLAGFKTCLITILIVFLLTYAPAAFAQSIYANLSGTVTDATGALVPGAQVTITNAGTNVARQLTANSAGYFSATQLPAGTYDVSAEAKGFKKWQGKGIVLNSSDNKTVSITLQIGTESETVEVVAVAGEVAITDTGEKFGLITSEQLNRLSLVGRNAAEFIKILPGAAQKTNGGSNRPASTGEIIGINGFTVAGGTASAMGNVAINGQQNTGLSINQDGQNVEDPGAPGGATPVNPNPDMISEVKVLTSNYGAENAKGPVVINTITKSGTSSFHGDVHFYARNSDLNAEDSFNKLNEKLSGQKPGYLKVPSHYYYPGFDIGGPVLIPGTGFNKDRKKFFFHESFEAYRQLIDGGINRAFVPTADMINNGDFSVLSTWANAGGSRHDKLGVLPALGEGGWPGRPECTITNGVLSSECISAAAQLWMQRSLPAPNLATPNDAGFNYITPVQASQNATHNLLKFDANFSENTKAYVTWSRQRENAIMPLGLWQGSGDWVIPAPTQTVGANTSDLYTVNFLHMFSPTMTVEARFGYTHMDMPGVPDSPQNVLRDQMGFPLKGVFGNPNVPVATSWGSTIPNIGDIGHDYHPTFYAEKGIPSYGGDLTKVFRTHTAKFGGMWERIYNSQDAWAQYQGVFSTGPWSSTASGNNYADLLMGENSGYFEQAMPPAIKMVQNVASFYATDHWQLTRRITIDYGLRFEHWGAGYPDDPWGVATFDKNKYVDGVKNGGLSWYSIDPSTPRSGAKLDFLVYSPRIGAAIDLFGNGKTVIRGGWGQYRYGNYVVASQSAANTALGSVGWGAPGSALTWEQVDLFINNGGGTTGSCAANAPGGIDEGGNHCAPTVTWGVPTDFTNGSIDVVDPHNHDQPYTTTYSLNINQRLPGKFMWELSYVGNHSELTQNGINYNSVPLGAMTDSTVASVCAGMNDGDLDRQYNDANCQQRFRPYKNYQSLRANESAGRSQYNSFQTSLTRFAGWATLSFNYTFSKVLGNTNSSAAFKDYGIHEYWSPLNYNRAHVFNAAYVFTLPKLSTANRFLSGAVNGWEVSGITQIQSGAMLTAAGNYQFNIANSAGGQFLVGSPDVTVGPILTCDPRQGLKKNQYANPDCFALPLKTSNTIGNTRFPYIAGPLYWNSDLTLLKKFNITERQKVEFRFAAFNFMNHALTSFVSGDGNLKLNFDSAGNLTNKTDPNHACPGPSCQAFGYANYTYGRRILEFAAKYTF